MNKAMRLIALAGMSLAVGATISAGPAQAAPSGNQGTGSTTGYHVKSYADDYSYVVGYFRREWACRNAGWTGVKFGAWDKFRCDPVRVGWKRWVWELEVRESYWNWNDWDGGWPGAWPNKPDFVGNPFNIGKPYKPKPFPWKDKDFPWKDGPQDGPGFPWKDGPKDVKDGPDGPGFPWQNGPKDVKDAPDKGPGFPWQNGPKDVKDGPDKGPGFPWKDGPKQD